MAAPVSIEGFRDLRKDLRLISKDIPRELNRELRGAVRPVAADAARRAPRSTRDRSGWKYRKHLADTIRPFATAKATGIRSPAPHARIVHDGGRRPTDARNRQRWITVPARPFMTDAVEAHTDRLVDAVGDAIDSVTSRHGFK